MRSIILETEVKSILVKKWQKLAELCSVVGWKADLVRDELGYLVEDIFKQNVGMQQGFSFLLRVNF